MDKGIRVNARAKFAELNEKRFNGEAPYTGPKANTIFRKDVMFYLVEEFGCTVAAAATHYNDAFKAYKAAHPEKVVGLGRPEEKNNGGRKPKQRPAQPSVIPTPASVLLQNFIKAGVVQGPQGLAPAAAVETPKAPEPQAEETPAVQTVFKVCKKSDGSVVAEGLTFEAAKELVEKAKAAKKAALYWV